MATLSGGDKLARKLAEMAKGMEAGSVSIGFMSNAMYQDNVTHVAQVAFWNEFGTSRIPARPFFRSMIAKESDGWPDVLGNAAKNNSYDSRGALSSMGEVIKDQLQNSIRGWTDPPNAQSTIDKKGFNKPLTDTNVMHGAVTYIVKMGSDE